MESCLSPILMSVLLPLIISCLLPFPLLRIVGGSTQPVSVNSSCGNMSIPYPFGFKDPGHDAFLLTCNRSLYPPRPFWREYEVLDVSVARGEIVLDLPIFTACCNSTTKGLDVTRKTADFSNSFFSYSDRNKFTITGCATTAYLRSNQKKNYIATCSSACSSDTEDDAWSCSGGIGCCRSSLSSVGIKEIIIDFETSYNYTATWYYNPCSLAFLADPDRFSFDKNMIQQPRGWKKMPVILDWSMEGSSTCSCPDNNSECNKSKNRLGFLCNCKSGYRGNPYVQDGCQDINECEDPKTYPCHGICINTPGAFECSCPPGTSGDATKENGCQDINECEDPKTCPCHGICINTPGAFECSCPPGTSGDATRENGCFSSMGRVSSVVFGIVIALCTALALMISLVVGALLYKNLKRKENRGKFYRKNHGLLEQVIASCDGDIQRLKTFSQKEMDKATNKFNDARVLGSGGHGVVYKGLLIDNTVVAIKKAKPIKEEEKKELEVEGFINEVAILTQIDHRNVVRLIGCCLETEIPLLVYEYISNGTLADHIHARERSSNLSWDDRLRIATEIASAVAYMNSSASRSIFHRDLKTANVLLDEKLVAKVSDFGTSKSIMTDQTHITTVVQGTLGYLDPEYYETGRLTEKSDVYSFGVILLVLLTGEKPISNVRSQNQKNLISTFISATKENQAFQLVEAPIMQEAKEEDLRGVLRIVEECLKPRGEERPTMKEVEMKLQGLKRTPKKREQTTSPMILDEARKLSLSETS